MKRLVALTVVAIAVGRSRAVPSSRSPSCWDRASNAATRDGSVPVMTFSS